jgi:hypothetical protein
MRIRQAENHSVPMRRGDSGAQTAGEMVLCLERFPAAI